MERICMTICTRLRGFNVRNMSEEMNCRNLSSSVFSCGPNTIRISTWWRNLETLQWAEIECLLLFRRRVHLFSLLRWDRLSKRGLLFALSSQKTTEGKSPVVQMAEPSARDSGFVANSSERSIFSLFYGSDRIN